MLDTATLQSTSLQGDGVSQSASRKRVIQPQVRTLPNTPQPGVRSPSIDHTLRYLLIPVGAARIRSSYCLRTYDRRARRSRAHEIARRHSRFTALALGPETFCHRPRSPLLPLPNFVSHYKTTGIPSLFSLMVLYIQRRYICRRCRRCNVRQRPPFHFSRFSPARRTAGVLPPTTAILSL